jgi:hypothetical protein
MPHPTTLDARLMTAARRAVDRLAEVDLYRDLPADRSAAGRLRAAVADARRGVVALDMDELFGRVPTPAERRAAHRALIRLEAAGSLRRLRRGYDGVRVTHLQLPGRER